MTDPFALLPSPPILTKAIFPPWDEADPEDFDRGVHWPLEPKPSDFEPESEWFKGALPENRAQAVAVWKLAFETPETRVAARLRRAARRVAACGQYGREWDCPDDGYRGWQQHRCRVRTHPPCAAADNRSLFAKFSQFFSLIPEERYCRPGWGWKVLDFAFRCEVGAMPTNKEVRQAIRIMKFVLKRALEITARKKNQPWILKQWTYIRGTDFGVDNVNLHFHGCYFGPWLSQHLLSSLFVQATEEGKWPYGTSHRVWIEGAKGKTPKEAFEFVLGHMLRSTEELSQVSAESLALREKALQGTRRVQVLGEFYGLKLSEPNGSPRCPRCGRPLRAVTLWLPRSRFSGLPELDESNFGFEVRWPVAKPRDPPVVLGRIESPRQRPERLRREWVMVTA